MRKPGTPGPSRAPSRTPSASPLPFGEIASGVGGAVTAIAGVYAEKERTKQVVAMAERDKTLAVEETRRVLGDVEVRIKALDVQDRMHAREHKERMSEHQMRAQESADARELRLRRAEKVIDAVTEALPAPRGRLLK